MSFYILLRYKIPKAVLFLLVLAIVFSLTIWPSAAPAQAAQGFVSRSGSQLMLNGQPFRFSGANIYWLGLDENVGGVDYPTNFRVDDALATAKAMGANVIRAHTLGISVGCSKCIEPSRGQFNEAALLRVDYALAAAQRFGLKVVIPFTDNYNYYHGGKGTFAAWRGVKENDFYTNPQVIGDFKQYVSVLLNRVNTVTGVAYKNDPTIMAWETGNELFPPASWTGMMADYIKSIDSNHLVVDGRYGIDPAALSLKNVDIYSDHFYPLAVSKLTNDVAQVKKAGKPMLVGEYDWANRDGGSALTDFLGIIENNPAIAGDFYWSLFGHNDTNGYVQHLDNYTLHFPGDNQDMRNRVQLLTTHALNLGQTNTAARSNLVAASPATEAPLVTSLINNGSANLLTWRGVAGADRYSVERATAGPDGPWTLVCDKCAGDNETPWTDQATPAGQAWYRVRAFNMAGVAGSYSAVAAINNGSVSAQAVVSVDNLTDWSKTYSHSASLTFDTSNSANFEGDVSRVRRNSPTADEIVWKQMGLTAFEATGYFWPTEPVSQFSFFTSADGQTWQPVTPTLNGGTGNWTKYTYTLTGLNGANYVKMRWNNTGGQFWNPQVGRVVITSDPNPARAAVVPAVVDNLSDWSKVYSHSANLSFDNGNTAFFEGDSSRVRRNSLTDEEISWKQPNLKAFELTAYFWPNEATSHFSFYTSADGQNWQPVNPAVSGGSGDWRKFTYSLKNLNGVNFVKVRWNSLTGQFWNAQISKVTLNS